MKASSVFLSEFEEIIPQFQQPSAPAPKRFRNAVHPTKKRQRAAALMTMTEERESLFQRLQSTAKAISHPESYPDYDDQVATAEPRLERPEGADRELWPVFARNFQAVNGRPFTEIRQLTNFLIEQKVSVGYCDPVLVSSVGRACLDAGLEVRDHYDRSHYDDYEFGITRASGGIAETGTLILTDTGTSDRLAALTPWIHIAVLPGNLLLQSLADALAAFGEEDNIIWATGPSKTADIEGILIEGVHGPGEQICLRTPE